MEPPRTGARLGLSLPVPLLLQQLDGTLGALYAPIERRVTECIARQHQHGTPLPLSCSHESRWDEGARGGDVIGGTLAPPET